MTLNIELKRGYGKLLGLRDGEWAVEFMPIVGIVWSLRDVVVIQVGLYFSCSFFKYADSCIAGITQESSYFPGGGVAIYPEGSGEFGMVPTAEAAIAVLGFKHGVELFEGYSVFG